VPVAEQALVERLYLKPGDLVRLGSLDTVFRATLVGEPDRLSGGLNAGPRVMIAQAGLADTGLMQLGSLANHGYRILTPPDTSISSLRDRANAAFPQAGWRIREASESSPQIKAFVERLALFLVLVGLTALVVGGVGVSNAVKGYLDGKTRVIAILKCLGAPGATIFSIYLFQVMLIAALGIVIGLVLGASLLLLWPQLLLVFLLMYSCHKLCRFGQQLTQQQVEQWKQHSFAIMFGSPQPEQGSGQLLRLHWTIHRRSDNKLLGEQTEYRRSGGDLFTFGFQPSNASCPRVERDVEQLVFIKGD
jgi:hypothetical protein